MKGTTTFELEPLLDLEMDFYFTPGRPAKLTADPYYSEPAEGPEYEIEELRVYHKRQWHKIPDWLWEILNIKYEKNLIEAVNEWLDER
jgi:hypothetical protein